MSLYSAASFLLLYLQIERAQDIQIMLDGNSTTQIKLPFVIAKPMQLSSVGCFLGSLLCGVATEVMSFNVGRMIQAFSAGLALLSSQIWSRTG